MTREEDVLAALDKPRALYAVQQRVDPANKSKWEAPCWLRVTGVVGWPATSGFFI